MKKTYSTPEIRKTDFDEEIIRMLSKKGFADLFWKKLKDARKKYPCTTQEKIFNELNEKYRTVIGCTRYSNFDSFRIVRDKK